MGHDVRTAPDGFDALALAKGFLPDVILLDIGRPRMNGFEIARAVRREPWGRRIILMAVTGWGQEADKQRSREAGFDHHLVKPVDPAVLLRLLEERALAH